jgi:WD40 repeat protein
MRMTPPWPATKLKLGRHVGVLKFSPCGSFLAAGGCSFRRQTCLRGHTSAIFFLSFSNKDGNYLASAGSSHDDKSIRIWPTDSTRLPQQSDKMLGGHHQGRIISCLDFSPVDSNLLASVEYGTTIKLWNVEQEVCIYSFDHRRGYISSLFFPVQDEGHTCIFVASNGWQVRTHWGNDLSGSIESDMDGRNTRAGRIGDFRLEFLRVTSRSRVL